MVRHWVAVLLLFALVFEGAEARAEGASRLRVVLVLDASGSMKRNDPDFLARLAAKLLVDLADERDQISVVSFGSSAETLTTASGDDRVKLHGAIERVGRDEECTDYARGLDAAASELAARPSSGERRLVVFLTDGRLEPALEDGKKGCGRFEGVAANDREEARARVFAAADRLSKSNAKVYAVGLGESLAAAPHSRELLSELSARTGGRFLEARRADQLPEFFTGIFAALVGAPVSKHELSGGSLRFNVPEDSRQVHVVVPTDAEATAIQLGRVTPTGALASWPFGKPPGAHRGPELRMEHGQKPRGYLVVWLKEPAAGQYELARTSGSGPLRAWVISDVGLSLRVENVASVIPETKPPTVRVALRGRGGKPVPLDPAFLQGVSFEVMLPGQSAQVFAARGKDAIELNVPRLAARPEEYVLRAAARHDEGFLQVEPVEQRFRVIHQVPLELDESVTVAFDTMADEGNIPLTSPAVVRVKRPAELPTDLTVNLQVAGDAFRDDVRVEPRSVTFGPGKPREVSLTLSFANPRELRWTDKRYDGALRLVLDPAHAQLASGKTEWALPIRAVVRSWTLARWLREYRFQVGLGALGLLLLIWAIGRAVAREFPPKARIHYVEVGQSFASDSLVRRFAKKGAYRSARLWFPLGKKARKLVSFVSTGSGFEVRPEKGVSIVPFNGTSNEPERRTPFAGTWEQRYRLGDRWEVWLTRT